MVPEDATSPSDQDGLLKQILSTVQSMRVDYQHLSAAVKHLQGQVNVLSGVKQMHDVAGGSHPSQTRIAPTQPSTTGAQRATSPTEFGPNALASSPDFYPAGSSGARSDEDFLHGRKHTAPAVSRIILTTYPEQSGIDPLIMNWGHMDALERGPVVVSRSQGTVRRRNGKRDTSLFPWYL